MCCTLIKYGLFLANLIFTLAGLGLVGLGIAVLVQGTDVLDIIPSAVSGIPISLIVIGSLIFLISFFGCCGAVKENKCLLTLYGISMLLLAAAKIYLAVVIFNNLDNLQETVESWLTRAFENNDLREGFHGVETVFLCCGTTGAGSYLGVLPSLPPSCCPESMTCNAQNAYPGCNELVGSFFETYGEIIGVIVIVIIVVELAAMIFSFCMCSNVNSKSKATV